jgi:hypothetical protein
MSNKKIGLVLTALTLAGAAGCGDKNKTAVQETTAATTVPKKGLTNPANRPEVVAAVQKVLDACGAKWDAKNGFDDCSDPMREFRDQKLEKADATFLNLMDDDDVKVRWMGVAGLSSKGWSYQGDKELAARLVDHLEKEKAPSILDGELAYLASSTTESSGVWERLQTIALAPATPFDVKAVLAGWWRGGDRAYAVVKTLSASPDKKTQHAAAQGWALHFDKHADEACAFWSAHFDDDDKDVRHVSVGHLSGGWSGNTTHDTEGSWYVTGGGGGPSRSGDAACKEAQLYAALAIMDKRATANTIDDSNYVYALESIAMHKKTNAKEKKQAIAILRKIVETKGAAQRSFALRKLVDVNPKEKSYAAKFAKDPDLKFTVESISSAPPPKK